MKAMVAHMAEKKMRETGQVKEFGEIAEKEASVDILMEQVIVLNFR